MFQYALDTGRVNFLLEKYPTLIQKRKRLAKPGQRLASAKEVEEYLGVATHNAGMRFLGRIHQEIWDSKPQWEKDRITAELQEDIVAEKAEKVAPCAKPELTADYLRSLGYDPEWGSE